MEPKEILKKTPFFAEVLNDDEIAALATRARFIGFPKGATPIEEDGPGHSMFIVVSGSVAITVRGDAEPIATLGPGDIFGEMSLMTGARRSATVTALEPVEAIEVNKQALAHVLQGSPGLVDRFAKMLARRQRELDRSAGGPWGLMRPGQGELHHMISSFFGKTV